MTNVKVHLKEITKYVLLLGLGIQIVLGVICGLQWLAGAGIVGVCMALCGVLLCALLGYLFLKVWRTGWSKRKILLGTLGITTTPMVLQAGLDMEKDSIPSFMLVVVFLAFFVLFCKTRKKWQSVLGMFVLVAAAILCCNIGQNTSFAAKLAGRCCFPHLLGGVSNVPQELLNETGYLELREALGSSDGIETILYPHLMEQYGDADEADRVCYRLAKYGAVTYTKSVLTDILWDYAGYHFPTVISEAQLQGYGGDAYTGYRYGQLMEQTGSSGMFYWGYCVVWHVLATALLLVSFVWRGIKVSPQMFCFLFLMEVVVSCLVMQGAGLFDYTKLLIVPFVWIGLVLDTADSVRCAEKNDR